MDYYERRAQGRRGADHHRGGPGQLQGGALESEGEPSLVTYDAAWKARNFLQLTERVARPRGQDIRPAHRWLRWVLPKRILNKPGVEPIAPSPVPAFWRPEIMAREMRLEEIQALVESFGRAALVARMSGFDGVELHGHEGYLLDQFMTPVEPAHRPVRRQLRQPHALRPGVHRQHPEGGRPGFSHSPTGWASSTSCPAAVRRPRASAWPRT